MSESGIMQAKQSRKMLLSGHRAKTTMADRNPTMDYVSTAQRLNIMARLKDVEEYVEHPSQDAQVTPVCRGSTGRLCANAVKHNGDKSNVHGLGSGVCTPWLQIAVPERLIERVRRRSALEIERSRTKEDEVSGRCISHLMCSTIFSVMRARP